MTLVGSVMTLWWLVAVPVAILIDWLVDQIQDPGEPPREADRLHLKLRQATRPAAQVYQANRSVDPARVRPPSSPTAIRTIREDTGALDTRDLPPPPKPRLRVD